MLSEFHLLTISQVPWASIFISVLDYLFTSWAEHMEEFQTAINTFLLFKIHNCGSSRKFFSTHLPWNLKKYQTQGKSHRFDSCFPSPVWLHLPRLKPWVLALVSPHCGIHNQAKALPDHCVVCLSHLCCTSFFIQTAQQTSVEKPDLPLTPGLPESVKSLNKAT